MSIEEAIMGGIVFKGKKDKPKEGKGETAKKRRMHRADNTGSGCSEISGRKELADIK